MAKKTQANTKKEPKSQDTAPHKVEWREDVDLNFLDRHVSAAPTFPISVLPPSIESLVAGVCKAQNLSPAYTAPAIIGALSGVIGNRWRIAITPSQAEPVATFTLLIGEPGSGRSLTIRVASDALRAAEAALVADLSGAPGSPKRTNAVLAHESQRTNQAIKAILRSGTVPLHVDDDQEDSPAPPLLLSDTTGAGVLDELKGDARGRVLVTSEAHGVLSGLLAAQANRGRAILLQAFDGDQFDVRLKSEGYLRIPALLLTVVAATHPDRVGEIIGKVRDGLVARFLWSYPETDIIHDLAVESGPVDLLGKLAVDLIRSGGGNSSGRYYDMVQLSDQARTLLTAASKSFSTSLRDFAGPLHDVYARARQQALRIGGLFTIVEAIAKGQRPSVVGGEDIERAVGLMREFFLPMAERALAMSPRSQESDASSLARHLRRLGKIEVNIRDDIVRGRGSPLRELGRIGDALKELQFRGIVKPTDRQRHGSGRPAQAIQVNAALFPG